MGDPPTDGQIEEGGTEGKERQRGRTDTYSIHANTCGSGLLKIRT